MSLVISTSSGIANLSAVSSQDLSIGSSNAKKDFLLHSSLALACLTGNIDNVKKITSDGEKISALKKKGFHYIYNATLSNSPNTLAVVKELLNAGFSPNESVTSQEYYPLLNYIIDLEIERIKTNDPELPKKIIDWESIVKCLVEAGANTCHFGKWQSQSLSQRVCYLRNENLISLFKKGIQSKFY